MSDDKDYMAFLENSLPANDYIHVNTDNADMEAQAAPNTDPNAKLPEFDPKGATPEAEKLAAAPTLDPKVDGQDKEIIGNNTEKIEPESPVVKWDGTGKFPSTFDDPLLSKIIDKFTNASVSSRFGVNEGEDISPLSLLEDEAGTEEKKEEPKEGEASSEEKKEEEKEGEDETEVKESYILKRLIEEMDEIANEIDSAEADNEYNSSDSDDSDDDENLGDEEYDLDDDLDDDEEL